MDDIFQQSVGICGGGVEYYLIVSNNPGGFSCECFTDFELAKVGFDFDSMFFLW